MRLISKSCASRIVIFISLLVIVYFLFGHKIFQSLYDLVDSDDKLNGKYDAVIIECWLKPQSTMIRIADSLYRKNLVKEIYITHFKYNANKFYTGGEVPKFIQDIINLYILEFSSDTSKFIKIPITPKDPITLNLAYQVTDFVKAKNYKRILILSESPHSQRTKLAFKKAFNNSGIEVTTLPVELGITKFNWWKSDIGLSTTFSETIKLIYYRLFIL